MLLKSHDFSYILCMRPSQGTANWLTTVEFHPELGSTNDRALTLCSEPGKLPALVVAERQTKGRGRQGSAWFSPEGSLTFSLAVRPAAWEIPAAQWPALSLTTAVAAADAVQAALPSPVLAQIKWPNDLFVNGRKLAGILLESAPADSSALVIGIGLNVNGSLAAAGERAPLGITLEELTGESHAGDTLLEDFLAAFDCRAAQLGAGNLQLAEDWNHRSLLTGRQVQIDLGAEQIAGRCTGLAENGALLVATTSGLRTLHSGTVLHW